LQLITITGHKGIYKFEDCQVAATAAEETAEQPPAPPASQFESTVANFAEDEVPKPKRRSALKVEPVDEEIEEDDNACSDASENSLSESEDELEPAQETVVNPFEKGVSDAVMERAK
jgi:hypothetical protein